MAAWTKEMKLDALMEILEEHRPYGRRCTCLEGDDYWPHLRQEIDNEGLLDDDPGAVRGQ
jgi:hypothetical protein